MFSIVIPIYNEAENISNLLDEIYKSLCSHSNYEIVIVNDCSTDNSIDIINNQKNTNIKLINNKSNFGQSYSIYKGVEQSVNEIIITIDGDGQNDPSDIPKLLAIYESTPDIQLVGGIRKNRKDSFVKIISSRIANYVRSLLLDDDCKDTGCSLKVFNRYIFLTFPYFDGIHRFIPALFKGYGHKSVFVNVNHRKREFGISKYGTMNRLFKGIRDIIKIKKILKNKNNE